MCVRRIIFTFLLFSLMPSALSQDESTFRDLLTHSREQKRTGDQGKEYRIKARSNRYFLDLNGDYREESFYVAKKDGEDWIHFFDYNQKEIFNFQFSPIGPWSRLYRVQMRDLNKTSKVLILYFYEGVTKYLEFQGNARVYFLTIDNNSLKTMSIYKGPIVWDEFRGFKNDYHQRKSEVSMFDLDKDMTREIAVRYGHITRVYRYLGKGKWFNFDDQRSL